jgi:hypothetical protein
MDDEDEEERSFCGRKAKFLFCTAKSFLWINKRKDEYLTRLML